MARIKAYIPPIHNNLEKILVEDKSTENISNRTSEIKDCCNNNDKIVRNHVLKSHEVLWLVKLKIANGVISINNFTII